MTSPTNTRRPTSHIAPFGVRMQPELKVKLEDAAVSSGRSLNAEIVDRLDRSFDAGLIEATPDSLMAIIEGMARLNLTLAERELDLQQARNSISALEQALHMAYRAIKHSPTEHMALDCIDLIEDLIDVKVPHNSHPYQHQRLYDEKLEAVRKAQQQVAKARGLTDLASQSAPPAKRKAGKD
jgi:hypothetical protein